MKGNCYVCTVLPHSSHSTRLDIKCPKLEYHVECVISAVTLLIDVHKWRSPIQCLNPDINADNLIISVDTGPQVVSSLGTVIAVSNGLWCVERKTEGENELGQIPLSHCKEVWNTSTAGGCCVNCLWANMDGHPQMNETQCKARDEFGLGIMNTQLAW